MRPEGKLRPNKTKGWKDMDLRDLRNLAATAVMALLGGLSAAQDLGTLNRQWQDTLAAVQNGDNASSRAALARFTETAEAYVAANGRNWQIEYLVGSLDCMFPDKKGIGREFLNDILESNRSLNSKGIAELQRQLASCSSRAHGRSSMPAMAPPDLTDVSTHYRAVGISGTMKGGGHFVVNRESSVAVSPIPAAELAARLVTVDRRQTALQSALGRLPPKAQGAEVGGFAVAMVRGTQAEARQIGLCLGSYAVSLNAEFQIESSNYMVTAYAVMSEDDVYRYARELHGLQLPQGVIAYSVSEDMSLVSAASGDQCGSMAHELVHLLIKRRFPGAPAWLEEGLASEVAIAEPIPNGLRLGWSWRDNDLHDYAAERPDVAELLDMPWSTLVANDYGDIRRAEARQAMAAVFIRYLDAKGKLPAIYFSVRDQHVPANLSGFRSYRSILEEKLGMPVDAIDRDFDLWFKAEARAHIVTAPERTTSDEEDGAPAALDGSKINAASGVANGCGGCGSHSDPPNRAPNAQNTANSPSKPNN
jgi:hypothetical protein